MPDSAWGAQLVLSVAPLAGHAEGGCSQGQPCPEGAQTCPPSPSPPPSPPSLTQLPRKVVFNFPSVPTASSAGGSQFSQKESRTDAVGDIFLASREKTGIWTHEKCCVQVRRAPPPLSRGPSRGLSGDPRGVGRCHRGPTPGPSPVVRLRAPTPCVPASSRGLGFTLAVGKDEPKAYPRGSHVRYCLLRGGRFQSQNQ